MAYIHPDFPIIKEDKIGKLPFDGTKKELSITFWRYIHMDEVLSRGQKASRTAREKRERRERALAQARREDELLRTALTEILEDLGSSDEEKLKAAELLLKLREG